MATIRFDDLGTPMQAFVRDLRQDGAVTDEDMDMLIRFVSVREMAKIFEQIEQGMEAAAIWSQLSSKLQARKQQQQERQVAEEEDPARRQQVQLLRQIFTEVAQEEQCQVGEEEDTEARLACSKQQQVPLLRQNFAAGAPEDTAQARTCPKATSAAESGDQPESPRLPLLQRPNAVSPSPGSASSPSPVNNFVRLLKETRCITDEELEMLIRFASVAEMTSLCEKMEQGAAPAALWAQLSDTLRVRKHPELRPRQEAVAGDTHEARPAAEGHPPPRKHLRLLKDLLGEERQRGSGLAFLEASDAPASPTEGDAALRPGEAICTGNEGDDVDAAPDGASRVAGPSSSGEAAADVAPEDPQGDAEEEAAAGAVPELPAAGDGPAPSAADHGRPAAVVPEVVVPEAVVPEAAVHPPQRKQLQLLGTLLEEERHEATGLALLQASDTPEPPSATAQLSGRDEAEVPDEPTVEAGTGRPEDASDAAEVPDEPTVETGTGRPEDASDAAEVPDEPTVETGTGRPEDASDAAEVPDEPTVETGTGRPEDASDAAEVPDEPTVEAGTGRPEDASDAAEVPDEPTVETGTGRPEDASDAAPDGDVCDTESSLAEAASDITSFSMELSEAPAQSQFSQELDEGRAQSSLADSVGSAVDVAGGTPLQPSPEASPQADLDLDLGDGPARTQSVCSVQSSELGTESVGCSDDPGSLPKGASFLLQVTPFSLPKS